MILIGSTLVTHAQVTGQATQKMGYAETDYIMSQLPEFKKMDSELSSHYSQLQNEMKVKSDEFQAKVKSFQTLPASTPAVIRADKEKELATLKQALEKFKSEAQSSFQKKQSELLDPIYKKIGDAIEQVARENGYSFIINPRTASEGQIVLSYDERYNISDLVLKKLGVVAVPRKTLKIN